MARRIDRTTQGMNLDSLVDIVSNIVGALIILAAFMALFGLLNRDADTAAENQPVIRPPEKVQVPWSHSTMKHPVLFVMQANRLLHLDLRPFYKELSERPTSEKPTQSKFRYDDFNVEFYPVTNQTYCLVFQPDQAVGETWLQAGSPGSIWGKAMARYRPESFYYFFWVKDDSFELFREVRKTLTGANMEVGWKPITAASPLEICNGFEGSSGFQPQ